MPSAYTIDRRRQFREPVAAGTIRIDGRALPLVNWSATGFLAGGVPGTPAGPWARHTRAEADFDLVAGGERFTFAARVHLVRCNPTRGEVAGGYVCLDVEAAERIKAHFDPLRSRLHSRTTEAYRPCAPARAPIAADPPAVATEGEEPDPAGALKAALKEVGSLKSAFARRFHPDTAPRDASYPLRVELFKEFWGDLEASERRLRNGEPVGP